MADKEAFTQKMRGLGIARYAHTCEVCGGRYEQTPEGRVCGSSCRLPAVPVASGPYTPKKQRSPKPATRS